MVRGYPKESEVTEVKENRTIKEGFANSLNVTEKSAK